MEDIISVEEELWNQQMNATLNCSSLYSSLDRNWTELDSLQNNCSIASCPDRDPGPPMRGFPILVLEFAKILYGIVCLVGLCGNTLVIYVVLRFSKMQTVTNMYILNLAVADEMFLVGLPFLIATVIFKYWPFGRIMCKVYMTTTSINQFTSSLLLTVMSADRYVAVCHPISSPRYRTPFIAKFICLTVWTVSALLMVPIFMYANNMTIGCTTHCNIYWPESGIMNGQKAFTLYSFTLGFFIPCVLILLFYFLVICKLRTVGPKNKSKEKKRSHRKVTYLVLTVITVYVMCWLPYWIGQVYITFLPQEQLHSESSVSLTFLLLTGCLSYANSAINPILYAFLSENFKKSFAKAFTCATHKDINAQLNVENSVNPRTTRGASSQRQATPGVFLCDSTKRTKRDKNRLRDNFKHEDNDEDDDDDPHAFTNYVVHVNDTRHTGSGRRGQDEEDEDYVDEDEEDEPEVVEIEDSPNAIPMTTRITSYVRGSVMGNRDHGTNRKMNDKQVLLDDPLKHDDRGGLSDPTVL